MSESVGGKIEVQSYWKHNTAFPDELALDAKVRGRPNAQHLVCGDGLLIQCLAPIAERVDM